MLELRTYTKAEITKILGSEGRQAITRKLDSWHIEYSEHERGDDFSVSINKIANPFKVYCMLDLGFAPQTDFKKLREFCYYYLCDTEFRAMPDEVKESRMKGWGRSLTRQTMARYERKFYDAGLFADGGTYIYYFANGDSQRICDETEYKEAWKDYWKDKERFIWTAPCIALMREKYGGVARKQAIPDYCAFDVDTINYFISLVVDGMEEDFSIEF